MQMLRGKAPCDREITTRSYPWRRVRTAVNELAVGGRPKVAWRLPDRFSNVQDGCLAIQSCRHAPCAVSGIVWDVSLTRLQIRDRRHTECAYYFDVSRLT